MFSRELQVKMVKKNKKAPVTPDQSDTELQGKTAIVGFVLERVVEKVGNAVISYVVLDTIRQVLVARASRP